MGLFKNKKKQELICSPVNGEQKNIKEVKDAAFSSESLGKSICVKPSLGEIFSPVDGEILMIFPSKHAIGIKSENGAEILIHVGLDTVELDGEGFVSFVEQGQKVVKGQSLLTFDMKLIEDKKYDDIVIMIVTNSFDWKEISVETNGVVTKETVVMSLEKQ